MIEDIINKFDNKEKSIQLQTRNVLTQEQTSIFRHIMKTYEHSKIGVIQGSSGTGKTVLIRAIKKHCDSNGVNCVVTASTGKASSALGGVTIHSYIGLSMHENQNAESAEDAFVLSTREGAEIVDPDILIIDEMSMIGKKLLDEILKKKFRYILFVGDMNQLPPVKDMKVDWRGMATHYYELTKTLRTKDEKLSKVFHDFKLQKEGKLDDLNIFDYVNGDNIIEVDYDDIGKLPLKSECCFVGYRNKLVEKFSDILTREDNTMFNLNVGISVTALVCDKDFSQDERGYYNREFVQQQRYFNGEDVEIIQLTETTQRLVDKGFARYDKWYLKLTKNGIMITDATAKREKWEAESKAPKYYIGFPQDEVLEYCTLSIINGDTFALVWDGSEEEFNDMIEYYFQLLHPYLRRLQIINKYYRGEDVDISKLPYEVKYEMQNLKKKDFFAWYEWHEDTIMRKRGWKNLYDAKSVISARPTSSRTIHKAQGISVPAVIISDYSFYGASKDAQYVAVTRAKHGLVLVKNTPKELVGK